MSTHALLLDYYTAAIVYYRGIITACDGDAEINSTAFDWFDYFSIKCAAVGDFSTLPLLNCRLISIQLLLLVCRYSLMGFKIKQSRGQSADHQFSFKNTVL